jgi:hypothetical protein
MSSSGPVIDAHAHCGIIDRHPPQSFDDYRAAVGSAPIEAVVMFSPVAEIYDRDDPGFIDSPEWRSQRRTSNLYLLTLENRELEVIPFFFIWNDFAVDQLDPRHRGIKWHRHADEPEYRYDSPECRHALDVIRAKNLPVLLEETYENTLYFINELARGIRVIIPHLGFLNGGYRAIAKAGLWERPDVYADTSLAAPETIMAYIEAFGHERLFFGSDFPFGHPAGEFEKIRNLPVSGEAKKALLGENVRAFLKRSI